jgi:hypothetical protein
MRSKRLLGEIAGEDWERSEVDHLIRLKPTISILLSNQAAFSSS